MAKKIKFDINTWLPVFIFALITIVLAVITGGQLLTPTNLMNIFNQSVATIIAGLGMLFVASMGSTDITCGVVVALVGCFGLMASTNIHPMMLIPVAVVIGTLCGVLLGYINAKRKVSSFMASLAMLIAYRAIVNLIMSNNAYFLPDELAFIDSFGFKVISVIVMVLIIVYVFHYTRFGVYVRGIGENEVAIRHTGVNVDMVKIAAFAVSGLMAGIAGIYMVARSGGTSNTIGTGFEMKVMMALFIAGIPVQGGMGSKVYKLLFGAPTIIMLESGLVLAGIGGGVTQLVRGVVLLIAVALTGYIGRRFANVGVAAAQNQKKAVQVEE